MIFRTIKSGAPGALTLQSADGWFLNGRKFSTESALKISTVSACMEIISNSIAMLPVFVMDEATHRHLLKHPLLPVLAERPNEMMTPFAFTQRSVLDVLCYGDSYVWNYRNNAGVIIERIPIPHELCEPIFDLATGRWWYSAQDPKTGQVWKLNPADISHYKGFSLDGIHGMSVLSRARQSVEQAQDMDGYAGSLYRNGGRPSGVLSVDTDLGKSKSVIKDADGNDVEVLTRDRIRQEWDRLHSGPDNAFRTAVLDLGIRYTPVAMTNADAQFVEQKNLSAEDICRFFLMPPHKVGLGKQTYASNEQNSVEFCVQTLSAAIVGREQEDRCKLLTISDRKAQRRVRINMAGLLRGDAKTRAEVEQIYRLIGAYSVNDILDLEDRPHVPGGDTRYASLNYIPLEFFEQLSIARNAGGGDSAGIGGEE